MNLNIDYNVRILIVKALTRYNVDDACVKLGICKRTLYYKIKKYEINPKEYTVQDKERKMRKTSQVESFRDRVFSKVCK